MVKRMGRVIGIKPADIQSYKDLHANVWPEIIQILKDQNLQNFSIFLREPENLLFAYWEYTGDDFKADQARGKNDPITQKWWELTSAMQKPLDSSEEGQWWAPMEEVFHLD